ncbi:hypothetical protein FCV25MIE_01470, partial [Fagus crenata]
MRCTKLMSSSNLSSSTVLQASVELDPLGSVVIGIPRDRVLTGLLICTGFFLGAIISCKDGQKETDRGEFGYNVIANA